MFLPWSSWPSVMMMMTVLSTSARERACVTARLMTSNRWVYFSLRGSFFAASTSWPGSDVPVTSSVTFSPNCQSEALFCVIALGLMPMKNCPSDSWISFISCLVTEADTSTHT